MLNNSHISLAVALFAIAGIFKQAPPMDDWRAIPYAVAIIAGSALTLWWIGCACWRQMGRG